MRAVEQHRQRMAQVSKLADPTGVPAGQMNNVIDKSLTPMQLTILGQQADALNTILKKFSIDDVRVGVLGRRVGWLLKDAAGNWISTPSAAIDAHLAVRHGVTTEHIASLDEPSISTAIRDYTRKQQAATTRTEKTQKLLASIDASVIRARMEALRPGITAALPETTLPVTIQTLGQLQSLWRTLARTLASEQDGMIAAESSAELSAIAMEIGIDAIAYFSRIRSASKRVPLADASPADLPAPVSPAIAAVQQRAAQQQKTADTAVAAATHQPTLSDKISDINTRVRTSVRRKGAR